MIKDIKILSVIITITILLYIYTFSFDEVPEILAQGMQPTMMPRLIFTLIVFLSLFQIYQNKNLVEEKKGIIVEGKLVNNTFIAEIVLAKHDENYMPQSAIDKLKEEGKWRGD